MLNSSRLPVASIALLVAVLFGSTACGGSQCKRLYPDPTSTVGFAWEATLGDRSIFLLGLHQAAPTSSIPNSAWKQLRVSTTLLLEVDELGEVPPDQRWTKESWMERFMLPPGQSLRKLLSSAQFQKLEWRTRGLRIRVPDYIASKSFAILHPDEMKPWVAQLLLSKQQFRYSSPTQNEALRAEATKAGLELEFLDTPDQQVQFLDESSDLDSLKRALDEETFLPCRSKDSIAAYRSGDDDAFTLAADDPSEARVARWLPRIVDSAAPNRPAFVALGTSLLVGPRGLVAQLRARGFTVKRL